jgi:periplasmic protein TonB
MNAAATTPDREPAMPPVGLVELAGEPASAPPEPATRAVTGERPVTVETLVLSADATPAESPVSAAPAVCPMFAGFLDQAVARRRTGWLRRATVAVSLSAHAMVLAVGAAYSFWTVDELNPPRVAVSLITLPAPPPPPPAARAARATPKPKPRPQPTLQQPVTTTPTQPQPDEADTKGDEAQAGEREGVEGGVTGGVAGAVLTSAAPPRLPQLSPQERQGLIRRYLEEILRTRIASRLRLPAEAERLGVEGTVVMLLAIDGGGRLVGLRTAGACPHDILCEAAARTIREAAPFPPPPVALGGGLQAEMPLTYRLE